MSSQSHTFNAYESKLDGPILAGATSVAVLDTTGLDAPMYLVIDPDDVNLREWVRVLAFGTNTIDNMDRGLEGSNGPANVGIDHASGAPIRAVYSAQLQDDLFFDINALETSDSDHVAASNPHPVYVTQAEGDVRYLRLSGGNSPTGAISWGGQLITNLADSQADGDAANRGQVLAADQAHLDAVEPHSNYVKKAGDTMSGILDMGNAKITSLGAPTLNGDAATKQFVDDSIGALPAPFSGVHGDLSGIASDDHHNKLHAHDGADGSGTVAHGDITGIGTSDHHIRFSDANARSAVDNGTYLKLTPAGDQTITAGNLILAGGGSIQAYDASPPAGGDLNNFQLRNIIASDANLSGGPPSAGIGINGDVYIEYSFSAGTTGARVWVKVSGVWRGQP